MKVGQAESIEVWDESTYAAVVVDVVETVSTYPGSEGKPRLRHVFRVSNPAGEHITVPYFTGATLSRHPKATLRPLVATLRPDLDLDDPNLELEIGHPEDGAAHPDDALIGARCRVFLVVNAEKGRNDIAKVLAATPVRRVQRPAEPVAARAATNGTHRPAEDEAGF